MVAAGWTGVKHRRASSTGVEAVGRGLGADAYAVQLLAAAYANTVDDVRHNAVFAAVDASTYGGKRSIQKELTAVCGAFMRACAW